MIKGMRNTFFGVKHKNDIRLPLPPSGVPGGGNKGVSWSGVIHQIMKAGCLDQILAVVIAALPQVVRQRCFTSDRPISATTASVAKIVKPT